MMYLITYVTKRSLRELEKKRIVYSKQFFKAGDVFECIDAGKKSVSITLSCEPLDHYRQDMRNGIIEPKRLLFSKTGPYKDAVVIDHLDITYVKKCLNGKANLIIENPGTAELFKNFIPKRRKVTALKKTNTLTNSRKTYDLQSLRAEDFFSREKKYHNEMQEMVDTIRSYFGERAKFGEGSFSYYIGFFKKIPNYMIYQYFGEAKQTKKSISQQKRIFWYKIGQYFKKDEVEKDKPQ